MKYEFIYWKQKAFVEIREKDPSWIPFTCDVVDRIECAEG